jgi:hypothetical protein
MQQRLGSSSSARPPLHWILRRWWWCRSPTRSVEPPRNLLMDYGQEGSPFLLFRNCDFMLRRLLLRWHQAAEGTDAYSNYGRSGLVGLPCT